MFTEKINLFNTSINNIKFEDIISLTTVSVRNREKHCIAYVNPHIIRLLNSNIMLSSALKSIDYLHADGYGIYLASKLLLREKYIIPLNWTDYSLDYLRLCEKNGWKMFFIGSSDEVLVKMIDKLKIIAPDLQISGYLNGYNQLNNETLDIINESNANILWIGLGSPKQEIWLSKNINKLNINIAQCVGDVFSYIAGNRLRGPKFFRKFGFEWLFRLLQHPIRYFNRYVIGIPYFFVLIINYKLRQASK